LRAPGVYRRGEVYLRLLQRASSVAFGTRLGRWLTLFLALPFGAAFGTIVFAQGMLHLLDKYLVPVPHHLAPIPRSITVAVLGIFFLILLHVLTFRRLLVEAFHVVWRGGRVVLIDMPAAALRSPLVRRVLESRAFLLIARYVLKPLP